MGLPAARIITTKNHQHDLTELLVGAAGLSGEPGGLEETARLILSTATSASSSVSVNYLIPLLLLASQSVLPGLAWHYKSDNLFYFQFLSAISSSDSASSVWTTPWE